MAQALAFAQMQSLRVNATVYETRYPDYDFAKLAYVDTTGPEWVPGVLTYSSNATGKAEFQSGYAKDIPLADVTQDGAMRGFQLAAIGYQWNLEEINTALGFPGANLPDRRARAARKAYMEFMYNLALRGSSEKGLGGLINYPGVTVATAAATGTSGVTFWVDENSVGTKTPVQILADINKVLTAGYLGTHGVELADTLILPFEAYTHIASTPYSAQNSTDTILSFLQRTNIYTQQTGRPLTVISNMALSKGSANGQSGRMVAYKNDAETVKIHLPMPHKFLPVYQDGPLNYTVPGIFRTGGLEVTDTVGMRYLDGISQPAKLD